MKASEQAKVLRDMAAWWLQVAQEAELLSFSDRRRQNVEFYRARAAAMNAGAEALERLESVESTTSMMSAKQTVANTPSTQKAEILSTLADSADALARLDCGLTDRAGMAQRAALFRECAAMIQERCKPKDPWYLVHERVYKRFDISVTEALHGYWYWMVEGDGCIKRGAEVSLVAAQAAAIAWVDGQEGK